MKTTLQFATILLAASAFAHAQVVPEATGPAKLPLSGNLQYALRYSQTAEFGGTLGDWQTANVSASVNYTNGTTRHPFNLNYTGGYEKTFVGPDYGTGLFQHLLISQGLVGRRWNLFVSDNVSYLPQSPTTGFSGVAGTGDIGGSGSNPPSTQSVLTLDTRTMENTATAQIGYHLNYATTLTLGGDSDLLRYPDGNGLDTDGLAANAGLTRRLDARNSLTGQFIFSRYYYPGQALNTDQSSESAPYPAFDIKTATIGFTRVWSPKIETTLSVGPQWIDSSDSAIEPPLTTVAVNAAVNYGFRSESASLSYQRGANSGGGILPGATVDSVNAGFSRVFGRDLTIGLTASYMRSDALEVGGASIDARYGGVQATRQLGRYLSVFASYTAVDQSSDQAAQLNVLNQLYQVIGFGIAYSPRQMHLRQ